MFFAGRIKDWLIRKVIVGMVLGWLDKWLSKLPGNDAKTVTGFIVALLGIILQELPTSGDYVQPVLDHLHELPAEAIVGGGLLWGFVGIFHKGVKWVKARFGAPPAI